MSDVARLGELLKEGIDMQNERIDAVANILLELQVSLGCLTALLCERGVITEQDFFTTRNALGPILRAKINPEAVRIKEHTDA